MQFYEKLVTNHSFTNPCAITLGNFDGVHLGHQMLFQTMRKEVGPEGTVAGLTFSNHPSSVLSTHPVQFIQSNRLKIKHLEKTEIDILFCIPFTKEIAALSYNNFLDTLYATLPFDHLYLGQGASLGKNREGTAEKVIKWGQEHRVSVHHLEKRSFDHHIVSSRRIRKCIEEGNIKLTTQLLGHPFAIEGSVLSGQLSIPSNQCMPRNGSYLAIVETTTDRSKATIEIKNKQVYLPKKIENQPLVLELIDRID